LLEALTQRQWQLELQERFFCHQLGLELKRLQMPELESKLVLAPKLAL